MYLVEFHDAINALTTTVESTYHTFQERIALLESLIEKAEFLLDSGNPTSEEITNWKIDCDSMAGFNFLKEKTNGQK